ncbi:GNAT family N-acetyltransferase [Paenibacillus zeisoli]|uniref:GNAT family N-acetyltransferase n=1 Tax=Paenibacillus zeisoli TaxID=2496267 RepID=A0A433XP05_9BACL|nr:GNAT family N-acetyltransferase [Paenibacillus zeisoli]RUT35832.1 GNAT family N-acetyltransferase [Paenibacillus zeisoli]
MQIRKMKPNDLSLIARVNINTFRETQRGIVPDAFIEELSYEGAEERFQRMLNKNEQLSTIFVAEDDDSVIGYAMGGLAREKVQSYQGELYGIYILPNYHGKGIGRSLMSSVANYLGEEDVHSMFVVVFSSSENQSTCVDSIGPVELLKNEKPIAVAPGAVIKFVMNYEPLPNKSSVEQFTKDQQITQVAVNNDAFQAPIQKGTYYYSFGVWWMDEKKTNVAHGDAFYNFVLEVI